MGVYHENLSLSFSGTNDQLGSFTKEAEAFGVNSTELRVYGIQNIAAASNNLSVALQDGWIFYLGTFGNSLSGGVTNEVSTTFDLTTESQVQLTPVYTAQDNTVQLFDSNGNLILSTGGYFLGASLTLGPGIYQLQDSMPLSFTRSLISGSTGYAELAQMNLQFTPVPEPRWISLAAAAFMLLAGFQLRHCAGIRLPRT